MKRIESNDVSVIGVIGIVNEREKYAALKLRREGKLLFPYTFADHEVLREIIALSPEAYTDTPVYFVVDMAFTIRDIFKPDATDITQLKSWIENAMIN